MPGLAHGLTTRAHGSIGPRHEAAARAARAAAVASLDGRPEALVAPHQVHGARIAVVGQEDAGGVVPDADGLVTAEDRLPLMVQGADCPLLLLVADDARALAVVHSGWRGTVARIAAAAVDALAGLSAVPATLHAAIFPGIGPCCFEVGPEVIARFEAEFGARAASWHVPSQRPGHALLDLGGALAATLVDAGVDPSRVSAVPGCTACGGVLWSHRASGGGPERHGLFALLRR